MKKNVVIFLVIGLVTSEIVSSAIVYFLIESGVNFKKEIFSFQYGKSPFDLLLLLFLRYCLLIGACIGICSNGIHGVNRVNKAQKSIVYLACFIGIYSIIKILYYAEDGEMDLRIWVLIGFSFLSCITIYIYWKLLSQIKVPKQKFEKRLLINEDQSEDNSSVSSNSSDDSIKSTEREEDKLNVLDKKEAAKLGTKSTVWKLLKMAKEDIIYLLLAFISLIACSAGEVFLPYYTGQVVNFIVIDKSVENFKEAMMILALITLFAGFASGTRAGFFTFVFGRYMLRLQKKLFSSILKMEIGFFDERKTGEITSRLTSDCTKVGDNLTLNVNISLRNGLKIIGVLFFMFRISWKLTIVTLVSIPIIAIISEEFGERYRSLSEKVQNSLAKGNASAEDAISNMRTVRSFAAEDQEIKRYEGKLKVSYNLYKKESILTCLYRWCSQVTELAMSLIVLYFGGHLVLKNELSGGKLISFILYSLELTDAFEEIGDVYTGLMEAVGASKNILHYIEREPRVKINENEMINSHGTISGQIKFSNVSFSYPTRPGVHVLNDISFEVKRGEIVALVGPSGGGKSSIVNLLERFYEPSKGEILIDNLQVERFNHQFLHEKMSLVQQEPVLFARTIAENISYGCNDATDIEEIIKVAEMANARSFIEEMPKKYLTETGEKGLQLSGGQKQRIAIARALIRNPSILILDEATSALDSESEHQVQKALNNNLKGKTVLIIAHRLSTIEKADKILVIDKGKIVEAGNHDSLMSTNGLYADLVKRQQLVVDGIDKIETEMSVD